ncbi:hypothetical protein [Clostridium gasigenes]|uniref:Helix-turn-helix domain-containing protein n=1 Tax=Clostridium gasigenes TaxID=94869 RepID=A0A1H0RJE6_9CLOT|nr:hypothetical protein [Clostridium gasigenes]MBB6715241.1 hypothetical protein [Clostridium gasigenes]SDP29540.1 hypothetical protein SAMN04488529_103218 [Clostridium gasigenes]
MDKNEFSKLKEFEKVNHIKREMSNGCSLSKVSTEIGLHKQAVKKLMERNKYLFIEGKFTPNQAVIEAMETIGSDNIGSGNVEMQNEKIKELEERIEKLETLLEDICSK